LINYFYTCSKVILWASLRASKDKSRIHQVNHGLRTPYMLYYTIEDVLKPWGADILICIQSRTGNILCYFWDTSWVNITSMPIQPLIKSTVPYIMVSFHFQYILCPGGMLYCKFILGCQKPINAISTWCKELISYLTTLMTAWRNTWCTQID